MILASFVAASAWACGPDFPERMLVDRGRVLLELPEARFLDEVRRLVPPPNEPFVVDEDWTASLADREAAGLAVAEQALVVAMRAESRPAAAWARGDGLPADVRHYTTGAVAWHARDVARAIAEWEAVLALPAAERGRRAVWASFMLGRANADPLAYEATRKLAREGAADPAGLAVSSLGQQARIALDAGEVAKAVHLYAEQAAHGSTSGALSLLFVARALAAGGEWRAAAADPVVLQLLVTWAWARPEELERSSLTTWDLVGMLPEAAPIAGADRIAALAYGAFRFDLAGAWAARSSSPLATWVRAKLALYDGDTAAASRLYAELAERWPADPPLGELEPSFSRCRLQGERAGVALARGEYVDALRFLVDGARVSGIAEWRQPPGWEDVAYVAERVLTVDELRAFVDAAAIAAGDPLGGRLRAVLARRLMREERPADAVPYFDDPDLRARAASYAEALAKTTRGPAVRRARAHLDAAALARHGLRLLGTEGAPDWVVYDGDYDPWGRGFGGAEDPRVQSAEEVRRAQASAAQPPVRFHYRHVAAEHALAAAELLPHTTQAYAVSLCLAASYLRDRDPNGYAALYRRYLETGPLYEGSGSFGQSCPEPDWGGAARALSPLADPRMRWFAPAIPMLLLAWGAVLAIRRLGVQRGG